LGGATAAIVYFVAATPSSAAEFNRFQHRQYHGWVEDTGTTVEIKLIPFILGPDTPAAPGFFDFSTPLGQERPNISMLPDGSLRVPFKIIRAGDLPGDAFGNIANSTGVPIQRLTSAPKSYVRAYFDRVQLEIAGEVVGVKELGGGELSGDINLDFKVSADRQDLIDALGRGDYRLMMEYRHNLAEFKSLSLDLSATQISNMWVNAFKEVVRTRATSGGKFLFMNFSRQVSRTRVKESVESGGSEAGNTEISIVMRDPTPEQEARANAVLGFAQLTREQMLQRHQTGFTAALAAANPTLADAHKLYLDALQDAPSANNDALMAVLGNLKEADALKFMVAGFQTSDSSASSYYRYDANLATTQNSTQVTKYREYLINNSTVASRYFAFKSPGSMLEAINSAAFQMHSVVFTFGSPGIPMPQKQWISATAKAVETGNLAHLRYALSEPVTRIVTGFDPDMDVDAARNKLIHRAAQRGSEPMISLLIARGASPLVRNGAGDTPLDIARDGGNPAAIAKLEQQMSRKGTASLELLFSNVQSVELRNVRPIGTSISTNVIAPGRYRYRFTDFPRLVALQGEVRVIVNLPGNQCGLIAFPVVVQYYPTSCLVQQDVPIRQSIRIRDNQEVRYRAGVIFQNWQTGFVVQNFESIE
jgi:hypothetical protein